MAHIFDDYGRLNSVPEFERTANKLQELFGIQLKRNINGICLIPLIENCDLNKAKEYLATICLKDHEQNQKRLAFHDQVFKVFVQNKLFEDVERETAAIVEYRPDDQTCTVVVKGNVDRVGRAVGRLCNKMDELQQQGIVGKFNKYRFKLESEDSSYDSDYEAGSDILSPKGEVYKPLSGAGKQHEDVHRTVSDTLGQEYAEYVTTKRHIPSRSPVMEFAESPLSGSPRALTPLGYSVSTYNLADLVNEPGYTNKVEFALKLGYSESQVQMVLQKLGPQPSKNELLSELIKLGSTGNEQMDVLNDAGLVGSDSLGLMEEAAGVITSSDPGSNLRHIVVDGSNVAMSHGNKDVFSCRGIRICVDWFKSRGHKDITVFVPKWRKESSRPEAPISDQDVLLELEKERHLVFTPSRLIGGRRLVCYDDRYILKLAVQTDGVVVSNDTYRDLAQECAEFKKVVEERLLMYSFVNDRFMPPDDPLGRHGPSLDNFLRKQPSTADPLPPPCPYGKKCTYGNKCKYHHPERGNMPQKSVTERLVEQARIQLQEMKARDQRSRDSSPGDQHKLKTMSLPLADQTSGGKPNHNYCDKQTLKIVQKKPLAMTRSLVMSDNRSLTMSDRGSNSNLLGTGGMGSNPNLTASTLPKELMVGSKGGGVGIWGVSGANPADHSMSYMSQMQSSNQPFFDKSPGGHVSAASHAMTPPPPSLNVPGGRCDGVSGEHRKLQRQLTLNPAWDPRLAQIRAMSPNLQATHQQQPASINQFGQILPPCSRQLTSMDLGVEIVSPAGSSSNASKHHVPLVRHISDHSQLQNQLHQQNLHFHTALSGGGGNGGGGGQNQMQMPIHQTVTRIASAPESSTYRGGWPPNPSPLVDNPPSQFQPSCDSRRPQLSHLERMSSISDSQLNVVDPFDQLRGVSPPRGDHQYLSPLDGGWAPAGMAQQQGHGGDFQQTVGSDRGVRSPHSLLQQGMSQQQPVSPSRSLGLSLSSPAAAAVVANEEARYKMYYHLAALFPPEQVQAVMAMFPEMTNPQDICAAILKMFPK